MEKCSGLLAFCFDLLGCDFREFLDWFSVDLGAAAGVVDVSKKDESCIKLKTRNVAEK